MPSLRSIVVCIALMACAACAPTELVDASGAQIYEQLCARCHGVELEGGSAPPMDIAGATDEELATVIRQGEGTMPSYENTLSDAQVARVVDFLRSAATAGQR